MQPTVNPATSSTYTKRDVSKAPEAFKASLEIMFCHMADMFDVVLTILSEKYGHSREEMLATLVAHPSYQSLPRHPVLDSLGYFGSEELPTASAAEAATAEAATAEAAATATVTTTVTAATAIPKKVIVRRKKLKAPLPSTE